MSRINPKYLENMTLFSRPLRHNVHFGVHWHYSQCWAMLQTLDKNSLGVKKKPAKHATCCLFLPWPLSVLTQRACLYAGGHVILCMRVGRRGKRVSFVFSLSKCVERDSKRNRRAGCGGWGGVDALGMCLCLCVEPHTCVSVTDWSVARFHRPSAAASPDRGTEWENFGLFSSSSCSPFPSRAAGRPHSPLDAKHTPPLSPWHFSYVADERVVARLPAACLYTWVNKAQLISFGHNV